MNKTGWFESDELLNADDEAFIEVLRANATNWPVTPQDTCLIPPEAGEPLIAILDVTPPRKNLLLFTVGVHVKDGRLRADRLLNQEYCLPEPPTSFAMSVSGTPSGLANQAAHWFLSAMNRPVVRHEWTRWGAVYAYRYLFPDTGEGLFQSYRSLLAPRGQKDRLIAAGHVRGGGWIQVEGIGEPDRIVKILGHF
ncbi:hypothetical protein HTZ77_37180 [Nonomuraea sp. SMC257]|uniref:Uncharacterized protein n=1 Tax=Nonomuraea montanisoli TaxID=2741721 RepID=A0A7Y6IF86_9ACTN|nr:hypothetical protein [Nonomuraea montanisoli]NUW36996.1 hypothetical protein [Nonomuraea montanisoli]